MTPRNSDGASFASAMGPDDVDEDDARAGGGGGGAGDDVDDDAASYHSEPADAVTHEYSPRYVFDDVYTSPKSLIQPKGEFNPWAAEGTSFWFDNGAVPGMFKVRGPTYLEDKQKEPCGVARMKLVLSEWLYNPTAPVQNISIQPDHFVQREHVGRKNRPFLFVINMMVPSIGNAVFSFAKRATIEPDPVFDDMLRHFCDRETTDDYRRKCFKILALIPEGSFIARKAVTQKPALICDHLNSSFFHGDNYFEVSIDVGSSKVAQSVMGAIRGFASGLTLQIGWVIEATTPETLPERLLGGICIVKPAMEPLNPPRVAP